MTTLLLALLGCAQDPVSKDSAPDPVSDAVDADGDGYFGGEDGSDCDDGDAAINPGAAEVCDAAGTDEDCDGAADVSTAWYADADGDGFGDATVLTETCVAPAGTVTDATDCDDTSPAVNPAALEVCDDGAVDEDCDGAVNDADPSVDPAGLSTWYADADGDSYGDATTRATACEIPRAAAVNGDDCDDGAAAVNPGAPEACDGVDNNCDGEDNCDTVEGVYLVDLASATVVQPPGIGAVMASYLPSVTYLGVVEDGATLDITAMMADDRGVADCDLFTTTADYSGAPVARGGPTAIAAADFSAEEVTFEMTFVEDGSRFFDGRATFDIDLRALDLGSFGYSADEVCALITTFGASCAPCPSDGEGYCVPTEFTDITGVATTGDPSVGAECATACGVASGKAAGLLLLAGALSVAGRRKR